jgi:hypothetical protein
MLLVQWGQALHLSRRHLALCMVILGLCADENQLHEAPDEQFLCWRCFQKQFGSECCNPRTDHFYSLRSSAFCELVWSTTCGWTVVIPRRFYFTITALTVDRGSCRRTEIWQTDLLERWHPMTLTRWKSLSSSVRPFYSQCLSMEIALLCAQFDTPVSNGCAQSTHLKGCLKAYVFILYQTFKKFVTYNSNCNW